MNQRPSTAEALVGLTFTGACLAVVIFCIWAWAMNDDFKQLPERHYYQGSSAAPLCTDTKVVRNGAYYELEVTDCVDN